MTKSLADIRYFLLDMDGTVYLGNRLLPGAKSFIEGLVSRKCSWLYFTNNPTKTAAAYAQKLSDLGIDTTPDQVLTSGEATARYLATETPYQRIYTLSTPSFVEELNKAGLQVVDEEPEAVVLAFDTTLTYPRLARFCHLVRAGLPYYATNPDRVCPTEDGPIPDCGSLAALVESATGRTPVYIGKPEATMIQMGLHKLGASPVTTAMIGDRLYTDMEMAYRARITSILVLSGETRESDLKHAAQQPDYVVADLGALHHLIEGIPRG